MHIRIADNQRTWERVLDAVREVLGEDARRYSARRYRHPRYRPEFTRFIELDRRIVAALFLRHDRMRLGTATLEVGHIEQVFTHPDYRGRGLFRALMADGLEFLRLEGFGLATLHGPLHLFRHFGFVPYRYRIWVTLPTDQAGEELPHLTLQPMREWDLDDVMAVYDASYAQEAGTEERTPGVWRWLAPWNEGAWVVQDTSRRTIAYARVAQPPDPTEFHVAEAAAVDGLAARALIAGLARLAREQQATTLSFALSPNHLITRTALQLGGTLEISEPRPTDNPQQGVDLARLIRVTSLLRQLRGELERRLAGSPYAGWTGHLRISSGGEACVLEVTHGRVMIEPDEWVPLMVTLPEADLVRLAFGSLSGTELAGRSDSEVPEAAAGLLTTLFPPLWPASRP